MLSVEVVGTQGLSQIKQLYTSNHVVLYVGEVSLVLVCLLYTYAENS